MNNKTLDQRIKERADELWEQAGRPAGRASEFWRQAHQELQAKDEVLDLKEAEARRRQASKEEG